MNAIAGKPNNAALVNRLTALWALSESGLGGLMHALKIPFTGFFLGGFAVIVIILIAHYSTKNTRAILQATLLVVLVKATVSPHSPPMAYIAVAFQGLAGTVILALPARRLAAILFGMIALFESAVQKFLVMTLIFGKSMWEALDLFFKGILKDLFFIPGFSFSFWLIAVYITAYTLWGIALGWWAGKLPQAMNRKKESVLAAYLMLSSGPAPGTTGKGKSRVKKLAGLLFILLFVCSVFVFAGDSRKAWYAIVRTVAALMLLFLVINPLVKWLIKRWTEKNNSLHRHRIGSLISQFPELRSYISPAMQLARNNHKGLPVYAAFVTNMIILALYSGDNEY